jgi:hypothetical protein
MTCDHLFMRVHIVNEGIPGIPDFLTLLILTVPDLHA